jgi:predicted GH43/DUF377 family glycosyl hydrolase
VNEFPGGLEDPRIVVAPDGTYILTYTQWARDRGRYTVGIATSKDLENWEKWGPPFGKGDKGQYEKLNYKSAGILRSSTMGASKRYVCTANTGCTGERSTSISLHP